jgi:5-formyltetrahydrofolate cyclo-ligase
MAVWNPAAVGWMLGLFMPWEPIGQSYTGDVITLEEISELKAQWRRRLLEQRRTAAKSTRSAETAALRRDLLRWIADHRIATVCAYVPVRGEPGSTELLDDLVEAGCRVLLPIVVGAEPLEWAEYTGADSLHPARYGLLEPSGARLGTMAIAEADALLVPALAIDRQGVRLGRGAGHYDRSLPSASASAELIGVVRDGEFVAELPGEDHDVRMTGVLTPERGVVRLPV